MKRYKNNTIFSKYIISDFYDWGNRFMPKCTVDKESFVSYDPNIKSCTAGYNLLSGQITYNKT